MDVFNGKAERLDAHTLGPTAVVDHHREAIFESIVGQHMTALAQEVVLVLVKRDDVLGADQVG